MKSLLDITVIMLQDCGMKCGANPIRDQITATRRTENEGDSFLTITLPAFCADFERSLSEGFLSPALFSRFKRRKGTRLPQFLGGFLERIFSSGGVLLEDPSLEAILCIRQICLLHKKIFRPCTRARLGDAARRFFELETELRSHVSSASFSNIFAGVSKLVWLDLVRDVPFGNPYNELQPRHGPGTTFEGLRGNAKFDFRSWPLRMESCFPFTEFGIGSIRNPETVDKIAQLSWLSARDELPVKVALVPKTLKSPRVIAVEPVCMQYMQQAISDWLRPLIEHHGRYTAGKVNFTDQTVNAKLALIGSKYGSLATIDMSDASDRVTCKHVDLMLRAVPSLRRYVFACRTTRAKLPSKEVIPLRKFASMGSALCFPMEAMVFFCTIVASRIHRAGVHVTPRSVKRFSERVYVYGDDIVVPADEAPSVCDDLESFGFRINSAKSFWTGKFRESCGTDAYDGNRVTPVYCRRDLPTHRADVRGIVSAVSFANQLYWAGYWKTAGVIRQEVENLLGKLPSVSIRSQVLGWESYSNAHSFNGWSSRFQRVSLRALVVSPRMRKDPLVGDSALLKCFRSIGISTIDPSHLLRSVRYGNLALKRRWT